MRFRARLGKGAPDPALETLELARRMPVPVFGLVPQRHLEDWDALGVESSSSGAGLDSCQVSISYTLWRNPEYIDDPMNLVALDDELEQAVDSDVPWERPEWILERTRRMRYPLLWECVRTSWCSQTAPVRSIESELAAHVNHILRNRFRETRVRGDFFGMLDSPVDERHVEHEVPLRVDGFERRGIRIDTDPDVIGVGVGLGDALVTAVIPRDEARFIELAFATKRL